MSELFEYANLLQKLQPAKFLLARESFMAKTEEKQTNILAKQDKNHFLSNFFCKIFAQLKKAS